MFSQLQQFWKNLSSVGKVIYGLTAIVMLGAVLGVGYWTSQTQYAVLFAKLPTDEAAPITEKLVADRVSHKIKNEGDGITILVPTDNVQDLRMKMAVAGLPQGAGKGYELFDSMSMGATPFIQNMSFVRAIQGELARTIMTLEPVAHARVHIVQPEPTPFVREEKPVTASIVIKTKPGKSLSRAATAGIVQLTAGSVKGLTAENVTVLDSDGRVLSEKKDSRGGATSNDQLSYQREVESHLASNAQDVLARVLGPGRAVVRVTAEMSFRHVKEVSEKYDPEGKVVQREEVMSSKMTGAAAVKGAVGAIGNIPSSSSGPASTPVAAGPNKNDETISTEYLVSRLNQEKVEQQGIIDRLTVAVILVPQKAEGDAPEDSLGITPEDARELVKQCVGFKEGRDQIQVSIGKAPGEAPAGNAEAAVADDRVVAGVFPFGKDFVSVVRGSALGVAGLLFLAIVVKLMRRKPSRSPSPSFNPAFASAGSDNRQVPDELQDLTVVAATIKAWLEEPGVLSFDQNSSSNTPRAKPA